MSNKSTLEENNARLSVIKSEVEKLMKSLPEGTIEISRNGTYDVAKFVNAVVDVATEEKTVTLNLANGDQVIEPSEGKHLSKVTITKPSTLLPKNIRSGVSIAGVSGTVEMKVATGSFTITSASASLQDNPIEITGLGFVPKYVRIRCEASNLSAAGETGVYYLISIEFGSTKKVMILSGSILSTSYANLVGTAMMPEGGFYVYANSSSAKMMALTYSYIAIGI